MKHRFTTALVALTLAVALLGGPVSLTSTAKAFPPVGGTPSVITATGTNLLFYVYGLLDGQELASAYAAGEVSPAFTLRELAEKNVTTALLFQTTLPTAFAYFWGRADALYAAAAQIELDGAP